jgi:protein TonB
MNYALSQPRSNRHPVGLMVVVGLHVVLAGALLSAKLKAPDAPPANIELRPMDEPKKIKTEPLVLPPASQPIIKINTVIPVIEVDHPPDAPVVVKSDDKPVDKQEPTLVASIGNKVAEPVRVTPHHGSLNASSEKCRPDYPASALRLGVTGTTRIRFSVDAAGHILGAQILQASGLSRENRTLDLAAATALAKCPVTLGNDDQGRAVPFTTDVDYVWALN